MHQFSSQILSNKEIAPRYFHMFLKAPVIPDPRLHGDDNRVIPAKAGIHSYFLPGQFVMLKVNNHNTPLLRRAMAILDWNQSQLEIIYKAIGDGTKELSRRIEGEQIDVIGPLGNSYVIPQNLTRAFLVTGGVGMVPLMPLAKSLIEKHIETILFFGGGSVTDLIMRHEFSELGVEVVPATMDGSLGKRGLVTEVMEEYLNDKKPDPKTDLIYTCGSHLMMHKVCEIGNKFQLKTQVSVETRMACGTGICLGCVIKIDKDDITSYLRACSEGPVFYGKDIDWNARID